jgi:hypothetical protein
MTSISNVNTSIYLEDVVREVNVGSPYLEKTMYIDDAISQFIDKICSYDYDAVIRWIRSEEKSNSKISHRFINNMQLVTHIGVHKFEGCVASASAIKDFDRHKACQFLIDRFGYHQLARYKDEKCSGAYNFYNSYKERSTPIISLDCIALQEKILSRSNSIEFVNYAGIIDFCAIPYVKGEEYVIIPFTLYESIVNGMTRTYFAPGLPDSKYKLFNALELNRKKNMNVILFENLRMASDFHSTLHKLCHNNESKYVVTSYYGGYDCVDNVDFSCLWNQNVYIVPSLSRDSYLKASLYVEKCKSAGVYNVSVSLLPILEFPKVDNFTDIESISDPFIYHIADLSLYWRDVDFLNLLDNIIKFSVTPAEYERWIDSMMLAKEPSVLPKEKNLSSIVKNVGKLLDSPLHEESNSHFSLDRVLAPKKLAQIVGCSNSGKTMSLSSLLVALSDGCDIFMFKYNSPRKILLVDVETSESELRKIYDQCNQIISANKKSVNNIDYISLLESQDKYDFDITSSSTQSDLELYIKNHNYDLFVIDNLQSLDSRLSSSSSEWDKVYKFFRKLCSLDMCVLVLHHTPDGDKTKPFGIARLKQSFQTIIVLEGPESINKELSNDNNFKNKFAKKYVDRPGTFVRISFNKCKPDPRLEKLKFQYHLPYVDITKSTAKQWIADPANPDHFLWGNEHNVFSNQPIVSEVATSNDIEKLKPISVDDKSKIHYDMVINYAKDNLYFNGAQIERKFNWSKRHVREILSSLVDSKKLHQSGTTSNRRYRFRIS